MDETIEVVTSTTIDRPNQTQKLRLMNNGRDGCRQRIGSLVESES